MALLLILALLGISALAYSALGTMGNYGDGNDNSTMMTTPKPGLLNAITLPKGVSFFCY